MIFYSTIRHSINLSNWKLQTKINPKSLRLWTEAQQAHSTIDLLESVFNNECLTSQR